MEKQSKPSVKKSTTNTTKKPTQPVETKRRVRGEEIVHHDLFKLELSYMKKNVGTADRPRLENMEHVHHYHTYDSYGKPQEYCSSVGGHTHKMEIYTDEEGNLKAKCGPAIRKFKKYTKEEVPFTDNHTHDAVYLDSHEVKKRVRSQQSILGLSKAQEAGSLQQSEVVSNERY